MLNKFFRKIDKLCLRWLGVRYAICPNQVKMINDEIIILYTETNQRFPHAENLKQFITELPYVNPIDKEKLGIAIGKAIATDLVISFEEVVRK